MKKTTLSPLVLALSLAVAACGGGGADDDDDDDAPPDAPIDAPLSFDRCDGGPDSFGRQAFLGLLGRRPLGQAEADLYADLWRAAEAAGQDPRAVVARSIIRSPGFTDRWVEIVADGIAVQRIDIQTQIGCWGPARRADNVGPALAQAVRDQPPTGAGDGAQFTMRDLARSSVALDDLTPVMRANVFAMVAQPIPAANVPAIEAELARRADFGAMFDAAYLNRDIVCLGCHTSEFAITDSDDPALDRHFPVTGAPERALFGMPSGIDPDRAHAAFRVSGFVSGSGTLRPWGWDSDCGTFRPSVTTDDIAGIDGQFASASGLRMSALDLDAALRRGFNNLRGIEPPVDATGAITDPDSAFAWLVTLALVEDVWTEVVGTRLTIANYFPRNDASAQILERLAKRFTVSGYSLEELLVEIVSTDYFDRLPPERACGAGPYAYPNVFDPWVISDSDVARRQNGPGDAVVPVAPRTLLSAVAGALEWPADPDARFPDMGEAGCEELTCSQAQSFCNFNGGCCATAPLICAGIDPPVTFQRGIGTYLRNSERGFRGLDFQGRLTWEKKHGACESPVNGDFIDDLMATAGADPAATVEEIVAAVKDRLIGEPTIVDDAERTALGTLLATPLTSPAGMVTEAKIRKLCGVLLGTPQFLMQGIAGRGGTRPRLTPADAGYDTLCTALATRGLGTPGFVASCVPGSPVTLVPGRIDPGPAQPATPTVQPKSPVQRKGIAPRRPRAPY